MKIASQNKHVLDNGKICVKRSHLFFFLHISFIEKFAICSLYARSKQSDAFIKHCFHSKFNQMRCIFTLLLNGDEQRTIASIRCHHYSALMLSYQYIYETIIRSITFVSLSVPMFLRQRIHSSKQTCFDDIRSANITAAVACRSKHLEIEKCSTKQ